MECNSRRSSRRDFEIYIESKIVNNFTAASGPKGRHHNARVTPRSVCNRPDAFEEDTRWTSLACRCASAKLFGPRPKPCTKTPRRPNAMRSQDGRCRRAGPQLRLLELIIHLHLHLHLLELLQLPLPLPLQLQLLLLLLLQLQLSQRRLLLLQRRLLFLLLLRLPSELARCRELALRPPETQSQHASSYKHTQAGASWGVGASNTWSTSFCQSAGRLPSATSDRSCASMKSCRSFALLDTKPAPRTTSPAGACTSREMCCACGERSTKGSDRQ